MRRFSGKLFSKTHQILIGIIWLLQFEVFLGGVFDLYQSTVFFYFSFNSHFYNVMEIVLKISITLFAIRCKTPSISEKPIGFLLINSYINWNNFSSYFMRR